MDLTVAATPGYFASMAWERWYLGRRAEREGPSPADYEWRDTVTSLTMGTLSLLAPAVAGRVVAPFAPRTGRLRTALVGTAVGAAAATCIADAVARHQDRAARTQPEGSRARRRRIARRARAVGSVTAPIAVATGGFAITTWWTNKVSMQRLWERRRVRDLGTGPLQLAAAIAGWDFIYYWNHRFMHTSRYMWAIHVVHHSSERYNLSTALRQPVADLLGTFVPYGLVCSFGIRPELVKTARAVNLVYQYWIHTDTIRTLGSAERVLNTPSHHRVHHGSNHPYLDRNHGSILITWDKAFGTFTPEREPVIYGLTKNIGTFNPVRVASHEHVDILRDVAKATTWRERLAFVLRGPGWAYARHTERDATPASQPRVA